jgi:hypothetical protein
LSNICLSPKELELSNRVINREIKAILTPARGRWLGIDARVLRMKKTPDKYPVYPLPSIKPGTTPVLPKRSLCIA